MILKNAENVYPAEIENRLEKHPAVREAAVYGVDHAEWGQEVKAVIVPEPGTQPDPRELARFCAETLAAYKVPTAWELRAEPLPRNPSGKILKNVLSGQTAERVRRRLNASDPDVMSEPLKLYYDYKSPFAFLAAEPAFALPEKFDVELRWIPFQLRIKGKGERSEYSEWKARYSYLDARRWANRRGGFTIRGPKKVYDSRPALIGGLFATREGCFREYTLGAYARFFDHRLELDLPEQVAAWLDEVGRRGDGRALPRLLRGRRRAGLRRRDGGGARRPRVRRAALPVSRRALLGPRSHAAARRAAHGGGTTAMSDTAAAIKQKLVETAQDLLRSGLVEGTAGNLSARLPDGSVVLSPSSLAYETMTPADLVVCDLDGKVLEGERAPTSEKALHLACLRQHPELGAVIHSHAKYATMFAITRRPIPCVIEEFDVFVGGEVPVADYKLTGSDELGEEVSRHVGERGAVLMANHGLLTVGKDLAGALKVARLVERTAEIVWGAQALGKVVPLPEETLKRFAPIYKMLRADCAGASSVDAAARVVADGYAILERAIEPALVAELVAAIDRRMTELAVPFGPNDFLGTRTRRLFNLLGARPALRRACRSTRPCCRWWSACSTPSACSRR